MQSTFPTFPWLRWKRSFHLNMTASGYCDFTEARQKAIVLHCLGQESQRLLFSTISDETYTTISKVNVEKDIKELFVKINVAGEKSTFRARHQKHSEPVESYVASLRELASTVSLELLKKRPSGTNYKNMQLVTVFERN